MYESMTLLIVVGVATTIPRFLVADRSDLNIAKKAAHKGY